MILEEFVVDDFGIVGGGSLYGLPMHRGERLRPCKGSKGSKSAEKIEQQRLANQQDAINAINAVFNNANREGLYDQTYQDTYALNSKEVNRQAEDAERANRFALARNGLLGGSADVDANAELNRRTNEGLAQATALADAARADLMTADQQTKNNLMGMATSGTDATTANQLAASGLQANAQKAAGNAATAGVGDLFGTMANAYLYNNLGKYAGLLNGTATNPAFSGDKDKSSTQNTYQGS